MDEEVQHIVKVVRTKHYLEASCYAFLAVAAVATTSWLTAWVSRGRAEEATVWGDIERRNGALLQGCIEASQTTCTIQIDKLSGQ